MIYHAVIIKIGDVDFLHFGISLEVLQSMIVFAEKVIPNAPRILQSFDGSCKKRIEHIIST